MEQARARQAMEAVLAKYLGYWTPSYQIDSDGLTMLAEHDDEVLGVHRDAHLGYELPHSGTYYLNFAQSNGNLLDVLDHFRFDLKLLYPKRKRFLADYADAKRSTLLVGGVAPFQLGGVCVFEAWKRNSVASRLNSVTSQVGKRV
jgi:hypothetical protein